MSLYNHLQQAALQVALQYDGGDDDFGAFCFGVGVCSRCR